MHLLAAECAHNCTLIQEYFGLLTDPAHVLMELTLEVISTVFVFLAGYLFGKGWFTSKFNKWLNRIQHRHDVEVHGHECGPGEHNGN